MNAHYYHFPINAIILLQNCMEMAPKHKDWQLKHENVDVICCWLDLLSADCGAVSFAEGTKLMFKEHLPGNSPKKNVCIFKADTLGWWSLNLRLSLYKDEIVHWRNVRNEKFFNFFFKTAVP